MLSPLPFAVGERLTYDLSWMGVVAGTAVMGVESAPAEAGKTFKLVTTARSSAVVSKVYVVDNRVESLIDAETLLPKRMTFRRREGKRKNDFDFTFNHKDKTVVAIKDGITDTLPISEAAHDTISCLYYARSVLPVLPGSSIVLDIHHDKKNYKVEVRVEAHETLKGKWGKVNTVRVLVIMPFQGIFLNEGNIRLWFTNDERRVPVKMKAKVIIGSVVADLVDGFRPSALSR